MVELAIREGGTISATLSEAKAAEKAQVGSLITIKGRTFRKVQPASTAPGRVVLSGDVRQPTTTYLQEGQTVRQLESGELEVTDDDDVLIDPKTGEFRTFATTESQQKVAIALSLKARQEAQRMAGLVENQLQSQSSQASYIDQPLFSIGFLGGPAIYQFGPSRRKVVEPIAEFLGQRDPLVISIKESAAKLASKKVNPQSIFTQTLAGEDLNVERYKFYKEAVITGPVELIPETAGGQLALAGAIYGSSYLSPFARTGLEAAGVYLGQKQARDVTKTPAERGAGATVALLSAYGLYRDVAPYAKGAIVEIKNTLTGGPRVRSGNLILESGQSVKADFVIEGGGLFNQQEKVKVLGVIPQKSLDTTGLQFAPGEGAVIRGGISGFSEREQFIAFSGKEFQLATSQASTTQFSFSPGESITLSRELYFTPGDPITGLPQTRISRLGLAGTFFEGSSGRIGINEKTIPQIGITGLTKIGPGGQVQLTPGTELEVIAPIGETIRVESQLSSVAVKGQAVQLFELSVGKIIPPNAITGFPQSSIPDLPAVSIESALGSALPTALLSRSTVSGPSQPSREPTIPSYIVRSTSEPPIRSSRDFSLPSIPGTFGSPISAAISFPSEPSSIPIPSFPSSPLPSPSSPIAPPPGPPPLLDFDIRDFTKPIRSTVKNKITPGRFLPSFTALEFDIKGVTNTKKLFTGLELRPIQKQGKRKKRKKKDIFDFSLSPIFL